MHAEIPQPVTGTAARFDRLTLAQVGWLTLAGAGPFWLIVRCHLGLALGAGLGAPGAVAGLVAAFGRVEARPAPAWVADWTRFQRQPRCLAHPADLARGPGPEWVPVDPAGPAAGPAPDGAARPPAWA